MSPIELWRRKVEQAGVILIDEASALLGRHPVLARDPDRCLDAPRLAFDRQQRLARLSSHDRRHAGLENTRLLHCDLPQSIAEVLGVIERHRRDHAGERTVDHVGRIQPPTHPDFEEQHIGRVAREQQEPGRGRDLEHGDGRTRVGALAFVERAAELFVRSEASFALAAKAKAFVEAHEMRRGIDVYAQTSSFQNCAHESDGRALAVGTGDMNRGRQLLLGMPERAENAPHPIERKIDQLRMQRRETRNDGIDRGHAVILQRGRLACNGAARRYRPRASQNPQSLPIE